tara:strand:- start:5228 stop:6838 length:1611 start_codon:yes stop_codon:yes gene_type:complete
MRQLKRAITQSYMQYILQFVQFINKGPSHLAYIKGGFAWQNIHPNSNSEAFKTSNIDMECILTKDDCDVPNFIYTNLQKLVQQMKSIDVSVQLELTVSPGVSKKSGCFDGRPHYELVRQGFSYMITYEKLIGKRGNTHIIRELLVYVSLYNYGNSFDITHFENVYINKNTMTLNEKGLLVHDILMDIDRDDKEFNIDMERREWLMNHYFNKNETFLQQIKTFRDVYKNANANVFKTYIINTFYIRYVQRFHSTYISTAECMLVEYLRPYMNGIVSEINTLLKQNHIDALCFIVGGDAMRRYLSNISQTQDIDTKLYYRYKKDRMKCIYIVINVLSRYITSLHTSLNLNSRFRYIQQHTDWPLDLCSWDIRTQHPFTDPLYPGYQSLKIDTAILDIAIQHQPLINYEFADLCIITNNNIAIANKNFLLNDLKKTYANNRMKRMRQKRGKESKNKKRFNNLSALNNETIKNPDLNKITYATTKNMYFKSYERTIVNHILNYKNSTITSIKSIYKQNYKYKSPFIKKFEISTKKRKRNS